MTIGKNGPRPTADSLKNPPNKNKFSSPLLNSKGPKNKSLPKKRDGKGGGGGLEKTARRLANGVIRDEVRDLRSQRREINQAAGNAIDTARFQYQRGLGDLEYIGGETTDYVNSLNTKNEGIFNQAGIAQSAAATALQQQLSGTYAEGTSEANSELSRLGINQDSTFLNQMKSDGANAQAVGALNSQSASDTLSAMGAGSSALGGLLSGMVQGSQMSNIGRNLNARNDAFMQTRQEKASQQALVRDAIRSAKGSRQDVFFQLLQQLKQTGWGKNQG